MFGGCHAAVWIKSRIAIVKMAIEANLKQILYYGAKALFVRYLDAGVEMADQVLQAFEGVGVRPGWKTPKR